MFAIGDIALRATRSWLRGITSGAYFLPFIASYCRHQRLGRDLTYLGDR